MRGDVERHSPNHHQEDHIRWRLIGRTAGKHVRAAPSQFWGLFQNGDTARRKRHPMLSRRFHPAGGNSPGLGLEIDLAPIGLQHLTRARGSEDHEFEGEARTRAGLYVLQFLNEPRYVGIGQGGVMGLRIFLLREYLRHAIDRVVTTAKTRSFRPVHHGPNALENAPGGLGLREPDGGHGLEDVRGVNLVDSTTAHNGKDIIPKRIDPLGRVLDVSP